ncbi:MAG: tRNA-dihydrouridine synthase [Clostridia bacterium]|nr:tRNA-dihydrouridine synthase [Clostridia bacterium]
MVINGHEINTVLAPMAGYTDIAFRELCKRRGAGLTVSEMVSVRGLVHGNKATRELMKKADCEVPFAVQLFGNDPRDYEKVAANIDADIIDVNMGCPMPKIVKNGDGSALLNDPARAGDIVRAIKSVTDKPVTVKTRLGFRIGENGVAALVREVAAAGASAVAIHGRYAEQRYAGEADRTEIERIAANTDIPVIVNGDIKSAKVFPPFAAVMIGRAALSNPAIFSGGESEPFATAREHTELLEKYFDGRYAVLQARKFFVHYFKGVRGGKELRDAVNRASSVAEVYRALDAARGAK